MMTTDIDDVDYDYVIMLMWLCWCAYVDVIILMWLFWCDDVIFMWFLMLMITSNYIDGNIELLLWWLIVMMSWMLFWWLIIIIDDVEYDDVIMLMCLCWCDYSDVIILMLWCWCEGVVDVMILMSIVFDEYCDIFNTPFERSALLESFERATSAFLQSFDTYPVWCCSAWRNKI